MCCHPEGPGQAGEWADKSLVKFNKKFLRRNNPRHQAKLKHRRFSLNLRKHFDAWVTEHWHRLLRGGRAQQETTDQTERYRNV